MDGDSSFDFRSRLPLGRETSRAGRTCCLSDSIGDRGGVVALVETCSSDAPPRLPALLCVDEDDTARMI